jgi:hypothetical protein
VFFITGKAGLADAGFNVVHSYGRDHISNTGVRE